MTLQSGWAIQSDEHLRSSQLFTLSIAMAIRTEFIENLAADIGSKVYIDIAKWHLYLNDAHLHFPLAEQLAALIEEDNLSESTVKAALASLEVTLGGGQTTLPLSELVPVRCYSDLMDALEEHQQDF